MCVIEVIEVKSNTHNPTSLVWSPQVQSSKFPVPVLPAVFPLCPASPACSPQPCCLSEPRLSGLSVQPSFCLTTRPLSIHPRPLHLHPSIMLRPRFTETSISTGISATSAPLKPAASANRERVQAGSPPPLLPPSSLGGMMRS